MSHQRRPTKRKRQSLKNSGFLPSKAWPINCNIQPNMNIVRPIERREGKNMDIVSKTIDDATSGMPNKWVKRLIRWVWLCAYKEIHSDQGRPKTWCSPLRGNLTAFHCILNTIETLLNKSHRYTRKNNFYGYTVPINSFNEGARPSSINW